MDRAKRCPRCGTPVRCDEYGRWWCSADGVVAPLGAYEEPSVHVLLKHITDAQLPTWLPWPMPANWSVSGVGRAGDGPEQATVLACTGPDPIAGAADLILVCEEPGVGLGAYYAGAAGLDVGRQISGSPAATRILTGQHIAPLWWVGERDDRDVLVGEASGRWLWIIAWPATAGAMIRDGLPFVDLRTLLGQLDVIPLSGLSRRL
jgi:hypothetical protein